MSAHLRFLTLFLGLLHQVTLAEIKLPFLFTEGAVLQQQTGAPIWGWAEAGQEVTVAFQGKNEHCEADENGYWKVTLNGLKASSDPAELKITAGEEELSLPGILVGEVWIASGQSNMEWRLVDTQGGHHEVKTAQDPLLKVFTSANIAKAEPQKNWWGAWQPTEPKKSGAFTAVGYYFAKELRRELKVPVGIIECAWGGKPIASFISQESLAKLPEAAPLIETKAKMIESWDPKVQQEKFEAAKKKFEKKMALWKETQKGRKPRGPHRPVNPREDAWQHSTIYHGMIAPQAGYGARGILWYQGEADARNGRAAIYSKMLKTLVADWRSQWGQPLSFYFVQLANYKKPVEKPGTTHDWVTVQNQMRIAYHQIEKSGIAIANDIGASDDIHPRNKQEVGKRLSLWALEKDYGIRQGLLTGPLFQEVRAAEKEGQKALAVSFHFGTGLKTRDGEAPRHFEISGAEGEWHWAQASIQGEEVVLSHPQVSEPRRVRYAWAQNPARANLVNARGLPASCFKAALPGAE